MNRRFIVFSKEFLKKYLGCDVSFVNSRDYYRCGKQRYHYARRELQNCGVQPIVRIGVAHSFTNVAIRGFAQFVIMKIFQPFRNSLIKVR